MGYKTYNLFISHSWSYSDHYERLKRLLDSSNQFSYRDYSVPKNDPIHNARNEKDLEDAIRNQMKSASCVLILAGVYSTFSKWIKIEIALAKELGKKIIAIEPYGALRTSYFVKSNADEVVRSYRSDSVINAIKRLC